MYINGNKLNVRRYSSGELKLIKSCLDRYIVDNKVTILYIGNYTLFELILVLKYYVKKGVIVDLVLSYLPYQRMDHEDRDELDTINYVANIFNGLNLNSVIIGEPHCKINMFNNAQAFSYVDFIKDSVFEEIGFEEEKDVVVLADKGGLRRYGDIASNVVYFNKVRDLETGLIIKHEIVGNIDSGRKAVIVDDIISTGDTIVNIIEELIRIGFEKIFVLAGHIENNKYNKRIFTYDAVKKAYSTNSLKKRSIKKLKLYDVRKIKYIK